MHLKLKMTLLCHFAWKKNGLEREFHPFNNWKKYSAVCCDYRQAVKEVVLGFLSGQLEGGKIVQGGSSKSPEQMCRSGW